jgi:zinc transport system substrate-binding protein
MRLYPLFTLGCLVFLSGCSASTSTPTQGVQVTASFYPLAAIAEKVGGTGATVVTLTPAGVEPHDYEPTPKDIVNIQTSDIFLTNGGIDAWSRTLDSASAMHVHMQNLIDFYTLEEEPAHEDEHETWDGDPHIWLDPVLTQEMTEHIRDAFIKADPMLTRLYTTNADTLIRELQKIDAEYANGLATCQNRTIVVSHNAFGYLGRRYGIDILPISGLSPEEEPSAKTLAELSRIIKEKNITSVFFETLASPKLAQTLAKETGAMTRTLNPIEGLTTEEQANNEDFLSLMRQNLQNLRTAMSCQ